MMKNEQEVQVSDTTEDDKRYKACLQKIAAGEMKNKIL